MAAWNTVSYRIGITDTSGAQQLAGANGPGGSGPVDVLIRAEDAGIFIGNGDVDANLPGSGYELAADQEYRFTFSGDVLYIATTSVSTVHVQVFITPHVA